MAWLKDVAAGKAAIRGAMPVTTASSEVPGLASVAGIAARETLQDALTALPAAYLMPGAKWPGGTNDPNVARQVINERLTVGSCAAAPPAADFGQKRLFRTEGEVGPAADNRPKEPSPWTRLSSSLRMVAFRR